MAGVTRTSLEDEVFISASRSSRKAARSSGTFVSDPLVLPCPAKLYSPAVRYREQPIDFQMCTPRTSHTSGSYIGSTRVNHTWKVHSHHARPGLIGEELEGAQVSPAVGAVPRAMEQHDRHVREA